MVLQGIKVNLDNVEIDLNEQAVHFSPEDIKLILCSGKVTNEMIAWMVEKNLINLTTVLGIIAMNKFQSTIDEVISNRVGDIPK